MEKITNLIAIISSLFFIYLANFLKGEEESLVLYIAIFSLYLSIYIFIYSLHSIFKDKDIDYGQIFLLGSLFTYYFQKHEYMFKETWRITHNLRNVNYLFILFFFIVFLLFVIKKDKYKIKNILTLENLRDIFLYILPFFILKGKEYKISIYFLPIILLTFIKKEDWKNIENFRKKIKIIIFISIYFFFCWLSSIKGFSSRFGSILFNDNLQNFILISSILLIPISKEMFKKIKLNLLISCIFPVFLIILEWMASNYSFSKALGNEEWTSIWAVRAVLISSIYIFFYFYEKKIILLYFSFLSILSMFLAQGRGPLLSFFIVFFMIILLFTHNNKKNMRYLLGVFSLILLLVILIFFTDNYIIYKIKLALQGQDFSTNVRFKLYKAAFEQWKNNKYIGYGLGTFKETAEMLRQNYILEYDLVKIPHAHNNILELLRSIGILGFLSYFFMQFYLVFSLIKSFVKTRNYYYFLPIFLILGLELTGVTDYSLMMHKSVSLILFITFIFLSTKESDFK